MSLADQLEFLVKQHQECPKSIPALSASNEAISAFLLCNQDAILAALRGRDAVLEEAALACEEYRGEQVMSKYAKMSECQAARSAAEQCGKIIRAMKEGKQ